MYAKMFEQMYDGTLATKGPWQALVTFQQLIILADREGVVDMTQEAISRRTTIPLEIICAGIRALEQPDSESRSPDLDGRRIIRLNPDRSWGWQIVNYAYYRDLRTAEDRRAYHRNYQRQRRSQQREVSQQPIVDSQQSQPNVDTSTPQSQRHLSDSSVLQTSVELQTSVVTSSNVKPGSELTLASPAPDEVERIFTHWQVEHRHLASKLDQKRRALIRKALQNYSEADICLAISGYLSSPHHMGDNDNGTKYDSIELMLRDSKHIDMGIKFKNEPPRTDLSQAGRRAAANLSPVAPELRNRDPE